MFPVITIVLLLFLPDRFGIPYEVLNAMLTASNSPRWYVEQGRLDDARDILARLNGPTLGEAILQEIQEAASLEAKDASNSYFDVFKVRLLSLQDMRWLTKFV